MKKFFSVIGMSFLLSLFILVPCLVPFVTDASAETLKIGVITSITGPMSPGFKPIYEAAKPAEALINSMGGVNIKGK